jgi:hypothetical protein
MRNNQIVVDASKNMALGVLSVELVNTQGRLVARGISEGTTAILSIGMLTKGVYLLKVKRGAFEAVHTINTMNK